MKVLIVDEEQDARRKVRQLLHRIPDVEISEQSSFGDARSAIDAAPPDVLLLEVAPRSNRGDGLTLLRRLRADHPDLPVVIVTRWNEMMAVREAILLGAADYFLKDELCADIFVPVVRGLGKRLAGDPSDSDRCRDARRTVIVGSSQPMTRLRERVLRAADARAPLLVRGATGSGKEIVARTLHEISAHRDKPFVVVQCAALPAAFLDSSGDPNGPPGADALASVELAEAGTVLFDEVSEMPPSSQAALLHLLENPKLRADGADAERPVTARIVASTCADLAERVARGSFREDLYYRLNVLSIDVPSLSERRSDIPELVQLFAGLFPRKVRYSAEAIEWLGRRDWPGNVRELRNVLESVSILAEEEVVGVKVLREIVASHGTEAGADDASSIGLGALDRLADTLLRLPQRNGSKLDVFERAVLNRALEACGGNKSAAARLVGLKRKAFERHWAKLRPGAGGAGRRAPASTPPGAERTSDSDES